MNASRGTAAEPLPASGWEQAYDPTGERPLRSLTLLTGAFAGLAAGGYAALRASGRTPPRAGVVDSVRIGVATHKLARMIGKDKVTSPYRAPFTRFEGTDDAPPAEVSESVRGSGMRQALGELITCPYCLAPWIATSIWLARGAAPREADLAVSVLESVTVSDFLQVLYRGAEKRLL